MGPGWRMWVAGGVTLDTSFLASAYILSPFCLEETKYTPTAEACSLGYFEDSGRRVASLGPALASE